jgi:hypothetical protein
MARKIVIESGINYSETSASGTPNNMLCCAGCQYVTVQFQNKHNSNLSITDFGISTGGSTDWNVSVYQINGNSPVYPFVIAEDQIIDVIFQICPPVDLPAEDYWKFDITTLEHGNEGFYYIFMNCVELADLFSITTIDFGTVPASTSPSTSFTFTNNTIARIDYNIDISGCAALSGTDLNNTTYPNDVFTPSLTWAAGVYPDSIACTIYITETNTGSCRAFEIPVSGTVEDIVCEEGACLCCVDIAVETVGGYLDTVNGLCDPINLYNQSSFLDQKKVVFQMYYPSGIFSGWQLQFNPNLFDVNCSSPFEGNSPLPVGYSIYYAASLMPNGTAQNMALNGAGVNQMNQQNYQVVFRPVDAAAGLFNVELTFFLIQDFNNFVDSYLYDNSLKLKRNITGAPTDYDNTFSSVYNANKVLKSAFFVTDPVVVVDGGFFRCSHIQCFGFTSRFYNKGLYNAASEFTAPLFTLERTAGVVTDFSTVEKTKVTFKINVPATYGGAQAITYHLFDETLINQTQNFLLATDSSRANITNVAPISLLDNHLFTPSTFTPLFGGNYECSAYVYININPASRYRIAAIVYANDGITVNTFISDSITVRTIPDQDCDCTPTIESTFNQYYQSQNTECIQPVAKERIRHLLDLTEGDFADCLSTWGISALVDDWRTLLTSITLNIYKRRDLFPSATQSSFFMYEQHVSVRNGGFAGNWQNFNSLIVKDYSGGIATSINDRRVRFDAVPFSGNVFIANSATYMQRTTAGALSSTLIATTGVQDSWINDEVYFEYVFRFDFRNLFAQPYFLNLVRAYKVLAIDVETNNSGYPTIITDVLIEGKDKITGLYNEIETTFCADNFEDIRLTYQADQAGDFLFITETNPFGIATLQENDELPSPLTLGLTQQLIAGVVSCDTQFDPVTFQAQVVLSPSFFANNRYKLCGYISINQPEPVCQLFLVHRKITGSSLIVVIPTIQTGGELNGSFNLANEINRFLGIVTTTGETTHPIVGETYVFEYSFSVPTTRTLQFYMGSDTPSGTITFTLPIGSTSGNLSFVWGANVDGKWCMLAVEGIAMTGTFQFKIGNTLCP